MMEITGTGSRQVPEVAGVIGDLTRAMLSAPVATIGAGHPRGERSYGGSTLPNGSRRAIRTHDTYAFCAQC